MSRGAVRAGAQAGYSRVDGYVRIQIDGAIYAAHRLAWLYVHGKHPTAEIDHRNGNPADNRIANLRECSRWQNARNRGGRSPSGFKGVSADRSKWRARIKVDGRIINLGLFSTPKLAADAYDRAALLYHGEFARTNAQIAAARAAAPAVGWANARQDVRGASTANARVSPRGRRAAAFDRVGKTCPRPRSGIASTPVQVSILHGAILPTLPGPRDELFPSRTGTPISVRNASHSQIAPHAGCPPEWAVSAPRARLQQVPCSTDHPPAPPSPLSRRTTRLCSTLIPARSSMLSSASALLWCGST
ncbi:MAG TPA: HNH endonuclease [Xanthobacteraceae bacterium]